MPFENASLNVAERAEMLNHIYRHQAVKPILRNALWDPMVGRVAMVSSFGAESVVLLHLIATVNKTTPVLFIDTEMLFPETLEYQKEVTEKLGLTDVRIIQPSPEELSQQDPYGRLHLAAPDLCCSLRKTGPLQQALGGFDAWITGRKRFQSGTRGALETFETDNDGRLKINPLAHWRPEDVGAYLENNNLPRHPLVSRGYPSIGCLPCTSKVAADEDPRAGRWRNTDKTECGIHFGAEGAARTGKEA